jgi:hypothetical protein
LVIDQQRQPGFYIAVVYDSVGAVTRQRLRDTYAIMEDVGKMIKFCSAHQALMIIILSRLFSPHLHAYAPCPSSNAYASHTDMDTFRPSFHMPYSPAFKSNSSLPPTIEPNRTYRRPSLVHLIQLDPTSKLPQDTSKSFSLESNASCGTSSWILHNVHGSSQKMVLTLDG